MAPLTHTPAFLLQLKHIKGMRGEAAALTPVPMAAIHLQRQKKARGLITRDTFPESLKGGEVNLWFLWAQHSLPGSRPDLRAFPVKAEIFMKCQGWWWEMNFASKCSLNSNQGLKELPTWRKERWFVSEQENQWVANNFRGVSPADDSWTGSDTPERGGPLFWMCPWRFPGANLTYNTVVWGVHWFTGVRYISTQDSDGARVEELVLYEKDFLQSVGCEFGPSP